MLDWLPQNVSTYGGEVDSVFYVIYYITAVVFFLVAGAMIIFLVKYRFREGRKALYYHGNTSLEIVWTSATFIAMIVLALASKPIWGKIKQEMPPTDVVVQVTGKQFNWEVLYPGPDKTFGTADDYQIDNEVHVPVNKVVQVMLTSKDVIHSFFVPQLRLKQDTLPSAPDENGRPTRLIPAWFEATTPGEYEIPCAELCGFGHSGMLGKLFVHTPEEYEAWVQATWPPN
jgi:cytochrome c oxidase subunit 2